MHDIRLIASDMDGTLFDSNMQVSERTAKALHAAQEKGVIVSLCTGRFAQFGALTLNKAGLISYVAGANGGSIWDDKQKKTISYHPISAEIALQLNDLLLSSHVYYYVFAPDAVITSEKDKTHPLRHYWENEEFARKYHFSFCSGHEYVQDIASSGKAIKFYVPRQPDEVYHYIRDGLQKIPGIYVTAAGKNCIEIMKEGVNKCSGVEELAALHGIDMKNVMTLGDYDNDIPMIRAAGLGVAMGNALDEVKACADYVTDTNDNDGVAKAIEKFVL